jgi:hypothetical protein
MLNSVVTEIRAFLRKFGNILYSLRDIAILTTRDRNTHSEDVRFIAFPLQQWLHERVP